jgi:hypothetical protein
MNMSKSELLLMFMLKFVLLITFFVLIFLTIFSTDLESAWNSAFVDTSLDLKQNVIVDGHCMQTAYILQCSCQNSSIYMS